MTNRTRRAIAAALAFAVVPCSQARAYYHGAGYYRGPVYGPGYGYNSGGADIGLLILGGAAIILLGAGIGLAIEDSVHPPPPVVIMPPPYAYPPPPPPPPVAYPP